MMLKNVAASIWIFIVAFMRFIKAAVVFYLIVIIFSGITLKIIEWLHGEDLSRDAAVLLMLVILPIGGIIAYLGMTDEDND